MDAYTYMLIVMTLTGVIITAAIGGVLLILDDIEIKLRRSETKK